MYKLRVVSLFSGYDSQCMALDALHEEFPDFDYELVAWAEIDPDAIKMHNAVYPQWADRNLGDVSKIDWTKVPDFDFLTYSSPCFVAGTMVKTDKGDVPIEKVRVGDMVLTSEGFRMVTNVFDNGTHNTYKTTIDYKVDDKVFQTSFEATTNHKIKTARGWVELKDLLHTDKVYVLDPTNKTESHIMVESQIQRLVKIGDYNHVYDIEVEEMHEFFAEGVLVHNCQDFSQAGKQAGGTEGSGTRSSLLWECRRAIETKKPKYLMLENVAALVSAKFLPLFNKWRGTLNNLGYESFAEVLNAKDYGVPQNRERIFLVSILRTEEEPTPRYYFPQPQKLDKCLADVLDEDVEKRYFLKDEMVEKFLRTNETTPKVYKVTDRFLTDEEIESLVAEHKEEPKAEPDEIFPEETNPFEC